MDVTDEASMSSAVDRILAEQGIPAFENVASLEALPTRNFRLIALPMKIRGGSGAPLRIIAIIPSPG